MGAAPGVALEPTPGQLHYLRLALLYGRVGAALRAGVSPYAVGFALDRLAARLGVEQEPDRRGPSSLTIRLALALGWLVIPPQHRAESCDVHGQALGLQGDGRRYCPTCAAERRLADARLRRGQPACRRGHPRSALNTVLEGARLRCVPCRRAAARARYRRQRALA